MKIAIIGGSGKMGKWFARFLLQEGFEVVISGRDKTRLSLAQKELGVPAATNIEAVKDAEAIILSVNIDSFEEVVKEISPYVKPEQVVIDVTSIKESPVEVMHQYLKTEKILGTHPLFGPGAKDLANQNFVLTPTNETENSTGPERLRNSWNLSKSRVSIMAPREHDEMMAVVLGLAHFISIVAADTLVWY